MTHESDEVMDKECGETGPTQGTASIGFQIFRENPGTGSLGRRSRVGELLSSRPEVHEYVGRATNPRSGSPAGAHVLAIPGAKDGTD